MIDAAQPYTIGGAITVPSGSSLTLTAGAELRFVQGGSLRVDGNLDIQGTEDDPVRLLPLGDSPVPGEYAGISIRPGASGAIRHARIEYANRAILVDGASFTVEDSVLTQLGGQTSRGIYYRAGASGAIRRNVIEESLGATGIYLDSPREDLVIEDNRITGPMTFGVFLISGSPTFAGNQITQVGTGIELRGLSSPLIHEGNLISDNGTGILVSAQAQLAQPEITGNEISLNSTYNYQIYGYNTSALVLNAENNFWGTTNAAEIAAKIADGGSQPTVDFNPFVGGSGQILEGELTSDTVLDNVAEPYQVLGDLTVPEGLTLTIAAGVRLEFSPSARLRIDGTLLVGGSAGSLVEFSALQSADWRGIEIGPTASGVAIQFARISGAIKGLNVDGASVSVTNSIVEDCAIAIRMTHGAGGLLQGNAIRMNGNGVFLTDASPTLRSNTLEGNSRAFLLEGAASPLIEMGNVFTENRTAFEILGSSGPAALPQPIVRDNDFLGNGLNVLLQSFQIGQVPAYDFTGNYFGTTEASEIASSFQSATGDLVPIDFSGFLDRSALDPAAQPAVGSESAFGYLISSVARSADVFRPTAGQSVELSVQTVAAASVTVRIYAERTHGEGNPLRTLTSSSAAAGLQTVVWDGRDEQGAFVPDEAYSYIVEATDGIVVSVYDPTYSVAVC